MKLRTDFVTNSSSSSFIFDGTLDLHELKKKVKVIPDDCYPEEYVCEWINDARYVIDKIVPLKTFCNTDNLDAILEILEWYDEVIEYRPRIKDEEEEFITAETDEEKEELIRRRRRCMASILLYRMYYGYSSSLKVNGKIRNMAYFLEYEEEARSRMKKCTPKQLVDWLLTNIEENWDIVEHLSFLGSENVFAELEEYAKELEISENWVYACFKELVPNAEYIYYADDDLHYLIAEAIDRGTDSVIAYCYHMG